MRLIAEAASPPSCVTANHSHSEVTTDANLHGMAEAPETPDPSDRRPCHKGGKMWQNRELSRR